MKWTLMPFWVNTIPTESTRNGMSSVASATIVLGESKPSRAGSGLKTLTMVWPWRRTFARRAWNNAAPARFSMLRKPRSSSATPW